MKNGQEVWGGKQDRIWSVEAVLWLRCSVTGPSIPRSWFNLKTVQIFIMDKLAVAHSFLRVHWFSHQHHATNASYSFIHLRCDIISANGMSIIKQCTKSNKFKLNCLNMSTRLLNILQYMLTHCGPVTQICVICVFCITAVKDRCCKFAF
jgi:hypothetical protein